MEVVLKQDKITFNHGKIVNIYIVYEINKNYNIISYPTLENCLFGAVILTNKKKDILILGEGPTQGLDGTTLTAEKKYSINFKWSK